MVDLRAHLARVQRPGLVFGTLISLAFIFREAVSGTADLLEILNSANGGAAVVVIVLLLAFNFGLSWYLRQHNEEALAPKSSKVRAMQRQRDRKLTRIYGLITIALFVIVTTLSAAVVILLVQNNSLLNRDSVMRNIEEQNRNLAQLFPLPVPPKDAHVRFFDDFDTMYNRGDQPRNISFERDTAAEIVSDPDNAGNQVMLVSGQNFAIYNVNTSDDYIVFAYRLKALTEVGSFQFGAENYYPGMSAIQASLSEVRQWISSDGDWHTWVEVFRRSKNTILIAADGHISYCGIGSFDGSSNHYLPGAEVSLFFSEIEHNDILLYDNVVLWTSRHNPLSEMNFNNLRANSVSGCL